MLYINICGLSGLLLQYLAQFSLFHSYMIILLGLSKAWIRNKADGIILGDFVVKFIRINGEKRFVQNEEIKKCNLCWWRVFL